MAPRSRALAKGAWGVGGSLPTLEAVADALHEGLQVLDPDFRYLYLNDVAARDHGRRSKEALLGRTLPECFEGVEHTPMFAELSRCMRERTSAQLDTHFHYPDGVTRWFSLRFEPVPQGLAVLSLDVDAHKRLEQEVSRTRAVQAASDQAGGMVHDFNNLLTVIMAASDLLDTDPLPPMPIVRAELEQIRAASERGAELMRRLRRDPRRSAACRVEVNDALRELVPMLRTLLGPGAQVEVDFDPDVGAVEIDPAELDRVLVNLVTNARDALANGGHVWLSTASVCARDPGLGPCVHGDHVRIRVADDGCGMDASTRARIFETFFSTKGVEGGSGLGLPNSHDIIQRAGGRITVQSEPGAGTAFDVLLPRITQAAEPTTPPPRDVERGEGLDLDLDFLEATRR